MFDHWAVVMSVWLVNIVICMFYLTDHIDHGFV